MVPYSGFSLGTSPIFHRLAWLQHHGRPPGQRYMSPDRSPSPHPHPFQATVDTTAQQLSDNADHDTSVCSKPPALPSSLTGKAAAPQRSVRSSCPGPLTFGPPFPLRPSHTGLLAEDPEYPGRPLPLGLCTLPRLPFASPSPASSPSSSLTSSGKPLTLPWDHSGWTRTIYRMNE